MRRHLAKIKQGRYCAVCWMLPGRCLCGKILLPGVEKSNIELRLLFNKDEVGAQSNTGKLMLMAGIAKGAVAELIPMDDPEMTELGLMSHAALLEELEEARRAGHAAVVLYPSDDAVEAADFAAATACRQSGGADSTLTQPNSTSGAEAAATPAGSTTTPPLALPTTTPAALATPAPLQPRTSNAEEDAAAPTTGSTTPPPTAPPTTPATHTTYVVILDSTYSQARTMNRSAVPSWLQRLKITPRARSKFGPLRDGGDERAAAGRTSTVEATALVLEALVPSFQVAGHAAAWDAALDVLVAAGLERMTWKSNKRL
jgi:DTW domain-containing protein YfiP